MNLHFLLLFRFLFHFFFLFRIITCYFEYGALRWASLDPQGLENSKVSFASWFWLAIKMTLNSDLCFRFAISRTKIFLESNLAPGINAPTNSVLQPIRVRSVVNPNNPLSRHQQSQSQHRWFSSTVRDSSLKLPPGARGRRFDRSSFPVSNVSKAIVHRGAAPFSSTLRPNLTGGTVPRSAGGYSLGAGQGARHFSHSPSLQAQVVQNVSTAVRAFLVNGGKARFDGIDQKTGEKRFKTVSSTEDKFYQLSKNPFSGSVKGTNLEFHLSPTITALSPPAPNGPLAPEVQTINESNLLDNLSIDFARALKDFSAVLNDLRQLSALGDLPFSVTRSPSGPILALRFPGCDGATVSRLCDEANVCRGIIREDEAWVHDRDVEMALLFPLAPGDSDATNDEIWRHFGNSCYFEHDSLTPCTTPTPEQLDWRQMMSAQGVSDRSTTSFINDKNNMVHLRMSELTSAQNTLPTASKKSLSDYESLGDDSSNFPPDDLYLPQPNPAPARSEDYEGLQGIYRFLKECEEARL